MYARIAKEMCRLGATTADLARAFDVTLNTIALWQTTHNEFSEACRIGTEEATDRIELSLYQRACGYEYIETKTFKYRGEITIVERLKHVLADVNACCFWLCNRRPDRWKDPKRI